MNPDSKKGCRYYVLYTRVQKQAALREMLKKALPEGRGTVFYPRMENYRRDTGNIEIKPIFPGYVFIRTDMDAREFHGFVWDHRGGVASFFRELGTGTEPAGKPPSGNPGASRANGEGGGRTDAYGYDAYRLPVLPDLDEEETAFLDFLLGVGGGEGSGGEEAGSGAAGDRPDAEALWKMSYGYREGMRCVVMEGPLTAFQEHIIRVNAHDRKACLDFGIVGRPIWVGLEIRPKRHWFPDDKDAPELLPDGTEVDLLALRDRMMGGGRGR